MTCGNSLSSGTSWTLLLRDLHSLAALLFSVPPPTPQHTRSFNWRIESSTSPMPPGCLHNIQDHLGSPRIEALKSHLPRDCSKARNCGGPWFSELWVQLHGRLKKAWRYVSFPAPQRSGSSPVRSTRDLSQQKGPFPPPLWPSTRRDLQPGEEGTQHLALVGIAEQRSLTRP